MIQNKQLQDNNYFKNVPLEEDTTILKNDLKKIDELPVLLQVWACDGTTACSAVIPQDLTSGITEEDLIEKLRTRLRIDNGYTFRKNEGFVFVNYGFCH